MSRLPGDQGNTVVNNPNRVHFTLSVPSPSSSRPSSPRPTPRSNEVPRVKELGSLREDVSPGGLHEDVYHATLPWWRATIRRWLVDSVRKESTIIASMQERIRTPWLDAYFVYTSSLGTHTFFMTVLPAFYFFGFAEMGRGLLFVLATGVYCSSFVKDLICAPRPFAPPVTRLTIGSHHLEYGFPSTHSTNSVSIALFLFAHIHRLASTIDPQTSEPIISSQTFTILTLALIWYTFSIVYGRLYTAMHSFTDCLMGILMGTAIWWAESSWSGIPITLTLSNPLFWICSTLGFGQSLGASGHLIHLGKGLGLGNWVEEWVKQGGWEVPIVTIAIALLGVNQHPQPIDDCPCFEDAIAFGSVVMGVLVGLWGVTYAGVGAGALRTVVQPGSGWVFENGQWMQVERTLGDALAWWTISAVKMVVGVLAIFIWRLVAKSVLHKILPPTFRLLARVFSLPNRRFYTPATDYKSVPSDFVANGDGSFALRPIPSVIDLPGTARVEVEVGGIGSGVRGKTEGYGRELKLRGGAEKGKVSFASTGLNGSAPIHNEKEDGGEAKESLAVKHYDADVLTKVIVYAGIGVIASEFMPFLFELFGWGVFSWPEIPSSA